MNSLAVSSAVGSGQAMKCACLDFLSAMLIKGVVPSWCFGQFHHKVNGNACPVPRGNRQRLQESGGSLLRGLVALTGYA